METDEKYMRRALELARGGEWDASPNPMVGAVVVADGRIIGEGYHRRCGEGHAEVNAIASVKERELLKRSTIYVTLEPCSHYGKTPPCARLIIESGIPRVVVGAGDPFPQVAGRGIRMLREAGVEVSEGVLEKECMALNSKFMTAHTQGRPYITLKWAESADGYIGAFDEEGNARPVPLSNELTRVLAHRERAEHDAILTGSGTVLSDNPRLDTRFWDGHNPVPVVLDRRGRVPADCAVMQNPDTLVYGAGMAIEEVLRDLYVNHKVTSLLVEGGAEVLHSFIDRGLWDIIRRETSPRVTGGGVSAPVVPEHLLTVRRLDLRGNIIEWLSKPAPQIG